MKFISIQFYIKMCDFEGYILTCEL